MFNHFDKVGKTCTPPKDICSKKSIHIPPLYFNMFTVCPSTVLLLSTSTEVKSVPVHGTMRGTETPILLGSAFQLQVAGRDTRTRHREARAHRWLCNPPCSQDAAGAASAHNSDTRVGASPCDPFQTSGDSSPRRVSSYLKKYSFHLHNHCKFFVKGFIS